MGIMDFRCEYPEDKGILKAVICIYDTEGFANQSPVNWMLEELQNQLKKELTNYQEIRVAYVHESPKLDVREFETLKKDTRTYYKEPCEIRNRRLQNVLFMGLALLEQEQKKETAEQRLYLLTDKRFQLNQVKTVVEKVDDKISIHPRFAKVQWKPILFKTENAGGDILEKYFLQHGPDSVQIFRRQDSKEEIRE